MYVDSKCHSDFRRGERRYLFKTKTKLPRAAASGTILSARTYQGMYNNILAFVDLTLKCHPLEPGCACPLLSLLYHLGLGPGVIVLLAVATQPRVRDR